MFRLQVSDDQAKRQDFAHFWIAKGFAALEEILKDTSGTYCIGDEVTVADICLVPQVVAAERFRVRLEDYPNIMRINSNLCKLSAFVSGRMVNQPDCLEELKNPPKWRTAAELCGRKRYHRISPVNIQFLVGFVVDGINELSTDQCLLISMNLFFGAVCAP